MSSRHLKKVYGESQDEELAKSSHFSDDDTGITFNQVKKYTKNPYELLNDGRDGDDDSICQEPEGSDAEGEGIEPQAAIRKKKRKGKKKPKGLGNFLKNPTTPGQSSGSTKVVRQLKTKEIQIMMPEPSSIQTKLFSLDPKFLNSEYELKKIFGSKVINHELGKSGHGHRKCYRALGRLIAPKDRWPSVSTSGVTMTVLEPKEIGFEYFKFEHDTQYREVQKLFMRAVDSHDPENILNIVRIHPYHIDAHIQLSDMSKHSEDSQVAAELVEIALHTMELGMDTRFCIYSSNCRLEFKYQENRAFHILLFKHLTFVGQRACHRTALELCKALLNLDPSDPLCVSLMLDFYSIKGGECQWFTNLYNLWNESKNLSQLPNWSYSAALAQYLLSIGAEANYGVNPRAKKSNLTKELCQAEREAYGRQSDELLQYSILMFPLVVLPLFDKAGIQVDLRVRNHSYFNHVAQNSSTDVLRLLCNLYVWRSHHLWKDPSILTWIERNTYAALHKIDSKEPVVHDYEQKRKRRYKEGTTPRNIIRHIFITDEKELTVHIPRELSKEVILSYDPLPPLDTIDIYKKEEPQPRLAESGGIINAFFQSFGFDLNAGVPQNQMRNFQRLHVPDQGNQIPGAEGEGNDGAAAALHRSVNIFVDAMRNLLTIATTDNLNENRRNDEESSDDDEEELPPLD